MPGAFFVVWGLSIGERALTHKDFIGYVRVDVIDRGVVDRRSIVDKGEVGAGVFGTGCGCGGEGVGLPVSLLEVHVVCMVVMDGLGGGSCWVLMGEL